MDRSLRQRGWSIHSSDDHDSRSQQRPRADSQLTCDTEPSMSEAEKMHLLNSAFEGVRDSADADIGDSELARRSTVSKPNNPESVSDDGGGYLSMSRVECNGHENGEDGGLKTHGAPPTKRRKGIEQDVDATVNDSAGEKDISGSNCSNSSEDESEVEEKVSTPNRLHVKLTPKQQGHLDLAKNKLSKWAARLFDPNRPRGLMEPPKVIPLNDEFLTAFGKREKDYDEISGRVVDIDKTPLDIIDVSDDEVEGAKQSKDETRKINFSDVSNCKVKISNLSYKTTTATIARTCGIIGPVVDVNLILDDNGNSSGRAYVIFEDNDSALMCVEKMNDKPLEGRALRITLASASGRKSFDPNRKQDSRYWERDISAKPNDIAPKPCGLCAEVGHDMRSCPQRSVCFNCGVPGHMARDCNQRRGLPERYICTVCYQSGHHRFKCAARPWNDWEDAVCMQCGQRGHLMCQEMRWFFGLKGTTCFNCGGNDHSGIDCNRPDIDECSKNPQVALNEIHMAGANSLSDQLSNQRSHRESRDSWNRQNSNGVNRARSMPPPRCRSNNDGYYRQGQGQPYQHPHRRY